MEQFFAKVTVCNKCYLPENFDFLTLQKKYNAGFKIVYVYCWGNYCASFCSGFYLVVGEDE
jgi:hypothetical protein